VQESKKLPPKVCMTAAGFLVVDNKVLLVKHKKLGIWLAPGGHIDEDELPHEAAEREFWEETAVKVKSASILPLLPGTDNSDYHPVPFSVNLHWISKDIYKKRLASENPEKRMTDKVWTMGCEKHLVFTYLVEATGSIEFRQNVEETDGISWFSLEDLDTLETIPEVKSEVKWALENQELKKG
jgi:8-oxo-dGTP pyrophosphatase MutT (NUDIX family)